MRYVLQPCIPGDTYVTIISEMCYSKLAKVKPLDFSRTSNVFEFETFLIKKESSPIQSIRCSIKICMDGYPCPTVKETANCPNTGADFYFKYQYLGKNAVSYDL